MNSPLEHTNGLEKIVKCRKRFYLFDRGTFTGGWSENNDEIDETIKYIRSHSPEKRKEESRAIESSLFLVQNYPYIKTTKLVLKELENYKNRIAEHHDHNDDKRFVNIKRIIEYANSNNMILLNEPGIELYENFIREKYSKEHPELKKLSQTDANLVALAFAISLKHSKNKPTDIVTTDYGIYLALCSLYDDIHNVPNLPRKEAHQARKKCIRLYSRRNGENFTPWFDSSIKREEELARRKMAKYILTQIQEKIGV